MSFWDHLKEMRDRIIYSLIAVAVGFGAAFGYSEEILGLLMWPLNTTVTLSSAFPYVAAQPNEVKQALHFTTLTEPFWSHLKIGLIAGLFLAVPVIMHQLWKFLAPGLLPGERKYARYFVFFSTLFFGAGVVFSFFVLLPFAVPFLMGYKTEHLTAILRIGEYVDFTLKLLLITGLVFELPLVIVLLTRMGVLTPQWLAQNRKYAFLFSFVLGAIVTPTQDVFNMTLLSVPIYLLYEFGLIAARIFGRKKRPDTTDLTEL